MKLGDFEGMSRAVEDLTQRRGVNEKSSIEALLVFEALYNDMLEQGVDKDTEVIIWGSKLCRALFRRHEKCH